STRCYDLDNPVVPYPLPGLPESYRDDMPAAIAQQPLDSPTCRAVLHHVSHRSSDRYPEQTWVVVNVRVTAEPALDGELSLGNDNAPDRTALAGSGNECEKILHVRRRWARILTGWIMRLERQLAPSRAAPSTAADPCHADDDNQHQ